MAAYSIPLFRLLAAGIAGSAMAGALGALVALAMKRPDGVRAAIIASIFVAAVFIGVMLALRPWVARRADRWPILLFGAQGGVLFGVLFGGLLLYSATRPDPVVFGLVGAAGFTAAVLGMALVYGQTARQYEPTPTA